MARLSREATCACEIVMGRYGPELEIRVRLPEPRLENEGMRVVLVDETIHLSDELELCGVKVKPHMILNVWAEIPALLQRSVKTKRALEAARRNSPILS